MIVVRGRSKSPWLLNYSHRTSGDLSVMVSGFLGVSGCCCVTRDVQKNDIDVAFERLLFENNCLSPLL